MNFSLAFTNTEAENVNEEAVRYATVFNPTAPIRENTEEANRNFDGYFQRPLFDFYNPVALINQQSFTTEVKSALYSYRIEYDLSNKLTIASQFSQDRLNVLNTSFFSRRDFNTGFGRSGQAGQELFDRNQTILNGTLRFEDEIFDRMNFTLLLGGETQIFAERGMNVSTARFLFDQGPNNLGAGGLRFGPGTDLSSNASRAVLNSLFGRANFNYFNTYFLSASLRAETYSGFGRENQTGLFPAVSIGTDLTQIFDMGIFNQFKLRSSFGKVGQLPPSPTLALGIFGNGNRIPLNPDDPINSVFVGINQLSNPNPQLRWETTEEITFGLDFALFQSKVTGQMDYYMRNISDLIFNTEVPVGAPNEFQPGNFYTANNIWANIGDLSSGGFEFIASLNNVKLGQISWTPTLNFTIYQRTRIGNIGLGSIQLPEIRRGVPGSPGQNNNPIVWNREGERIGDFYGPRFLGLTENGEYQLSAENPDGFETLGNALPTGDFGFSNTFTFGNWDLNFLLRGSWGHLIYNSFRGFYENADGASLTWNSVITENTPTDPLVTSTPTFSDLYLEKGDFVRLDNLQLGYNIPTGSPHINNLRVYAGVQNLFTITDYSGVDPEVRWTTDDDPLSPGIERRNTYFLPRIWTVGINLNFQ
jgi:iron complex outermembrane receptor protein